MYDVIIAPSRYRNLTVIFLIKELREVTSSLVVLFSVVYFPIWTISFGHTHTNTHTVKSPGATQHGLIGGLGRGARGGGDLRV